MQDEIKVNHRQAGCEGVNVMEMINFLRKFLTGFIWPIIGNTVINLRVPYMARNFTSWTIRSFCRTRLKELLIRCFILNFITGL